MKETIIVGYTGQDVLDNLQSVLDDPSKSCYHPAFQLMMDFVKNPTSYSMGDISNMMEQCIANDEERRQRMTKEVICLPVQLNTSSTSGANEGCWSEIYF